MTTVRHIGRAVGSTNPPRPPSVSTCVPAGAIERTITVPADLPPEQRDRLADIAERTPVTLAVRAGTPITTTFRAGDPA